MVEGFNCRSELTVSAGLTDPSVTVPRLRRPVPNEEAVIKRLLAEVCALPEGSIRADVPLLEYGLDSARGIDLLIALEGAFDIRIPDEAITKMRTLADVAAYIRERVAAR